MEYYAPGNASTEDRYFYMSKDIQESKFFRPDNEGFKYGLQGWGTYENSESYAAMIRIRFKKFSDLVNWVNIIYNYPPPSYWNK